MVKENKLIIRTANGALNLLSGDIANAIREKFERDDFYASCFTCIHMQDDGIIDGKAHEYYCKKWKAYPPLKVLVNSCGTEGYEDNDDIPF